MKRSDIRIMLSVRILAENRSINTTLELIPEGDLPLGELSPWITKKVRVFASEIYRGTPTSWEIIHVRDGPRNLLRMSLSPGIAVPSNIGLDIGSDVVSSVGTSVPE